MRPVSYPQDPTPHDLRAAAEQADANKEEAEGQVRFFSQLAQDLRTRADDIELEDTRES